MPRNYLEGTQIEIINEVERGRLKHALFDFDGTVSLLREGWQLVMAPLMVEMICGDTPPTPEIEEEVREFIDDSTGIQTILQMERLAGDGARARADAGGECPSTRRATRISTTSA